MNVVQLIKHLKTRSPRSSYYIFGTDAYLRYIAEQKIISRFYNPEDTDKFVFDGQFNKWGEVFDGIAEDSLLSPKRMIVVRNFMKFKNNKQDLLNILQEKDPSRVIVVSSDYRRHPEGFQKLESTVGEVNCRPFEEYRDTIRQWLDLEVESMELSISDDFKAKLVKTYGNSVDKIMNVLNQLSLFKEDGTVEESFFKDILVSSKHYTIFDLVTVVSHRSSAKALQIAFSIQENEKSPVKKFVTLFSKQIRLLFNMMILMKENLSRDSLAARLDINQFFLTGLYNQIQKWDFNRMQKALAVVSGVGFSRSRSLFDLVSLVHTLCS